MQIPPTTRGTAYFTEGKKVGRATINQELSLFSEAVLARKEEESLVLPVGLCYHDRARGVPSSDHPTLFNLAFCLLIL